MPSFQHISTELQSMLEIAQNDLTPEQQAELDQYIIELEGQAEDKIDAFCGWIKEQIGRVDAIKAEANRLAAKARVMSANIDRLKAHYLFTLDSLGKSKAEGKVYTISRRKSVKCVVFDESIVPDKYFVTKRSVSVSDIKDAIKAGTAVPGAELRDNYSLSIK